MGIFSGKKTTTVNAATTTNVTVNPQIDAINNIDVINNFGELSTVISNATSQFNGAIDKAVKVGAAIALLVLVVKNL
ncbi:MAG: hypothetical protein COB56_01065 [Robiginitomaculum sp.]|nr:MAG: hypothetical protein COB56_01065 [Robiginitomaculum sp.]